jgi:hypothetical protein
MHATTKRSGKRPGERSVNRPGRRSALLSLACVAALGGAARADEPAPPPAEAQAQAAPEPAARVVTGYVTEPGNQLPYLQYAPYQAARRLWTAGFVSTMAGAAIVGTGVGVLLVGGYSADLTDSGRRNAMAAGGVLTAVGAAGVAVGATLWHLGRRELGLLERGLPRYAGKAPMAARPSLLPSLAIAPEAGGAQVALGLGGRF